MKIRRVFAHQKKKAFIVEIGGKPFEFSYSQCDPRPTSQNRVISVASDRDLDSEAFTYRLESGAEGTVLADQILSENNDPEYARKRMLYDLTCLAQKKLKKSGLSKRAVSRRAGIAPTQLYRLLDQSFYGKTIDQVIKLLVALGTEVEFREVA